MKKLLSLLTIFLFWSSMAVQADYYVAGINDDWSANNENYKMSGSGPYSVTKQLPNGSYQFKITNGSWGNGGYGNFDQGASNVTLSNNGGNIAFTLSTTSDVTFYFNASTSKAYVHAEAVVVPSYTFTSGTTIYYDFTAYGSGINVYAPGNSQESNSGWFGSTGEVIEVTLSSDWVITTNTALFKSAPPSNTWTTKSCSTLPVDGQNMLVGDANGIDCHWDTYVPAPPTPDTYTVVGEVPGLDWIPTNTANDMTEDNGVYTLTLTDVELAANNPYQYKMVKNHAWTVSYPSGSANANFQVDVAGIYDVTFTLDLSASPEYSVTPTLIQAAVVIPVVKMHGTFADGSTWGDTQEFTLAGNNESASLTIENLPAGNYEFKVIVGSSWLGNGHTFYRDYTGASNIGDGGNMTLEADVAGDYTFTWTYETNALSIEFPAEPTPEYATVKFFAPRTENNPWEHVYAYSFKGSRKFLGEWPGTEITSTKDAGWYEVSVRKGSNLIFTDNAGTDGDARMQTNNIEDIQEAVCYVPHTINYEASPKLATVAIDADCKVEYYIAGSKELFGGTIDFGVNAALDENNQIVIHNVEPGTYKFKINIGNWFWALGGNTHLSEEEGCGTIATEVGVGDVGFAIATKQDVTITYNPVTQKICLGAETVKTPGQVNVNNMSVLVGETKQIKYTKNNTEVYGASYEVLSGEENIQIYNGFAVGVKAGGTATVRITIAESANYTAATADFTVNVDAASDPSIDPIAPIGGKFIINANGDTAVFSRGNLQYQQSTNTWRCAPNQYEWKGMSNIQMGNAEYEGWVDLFCWSLGAANNYGATSNYQKATYFNKTFVDWGTLFEDDEKEWSTLSKDELNYLLNSRPNANSKWGVAMIGDTLGMVLLPDVWATAAPAGIPFVAGNSSLPTTELWRDEDCIQDIAPEEIEAKGYQYRLKKENLPANKFTLEEWAELEAAGAVFLPFAGRRTGGVGNYLDYSETTHPNTQCQLYYENYQGTYWTKTLHNAEKGQADYYYSFSHYGGEDYRWGKGVIWSESGRFGQSVRLVTRIPRQEVVIRDNLNNGKWGTLCPKQNVEFVNGATFYQISYLEEQGGMPYNMIFDEISGTTLTAGKPYFFIAEGEEIRGSVSGAKLTEAGSGVNGFYGYIGTDPKALSWQADYVPGADNTYVIYNNKVTRINGPTDLRSERCYININATEPTRAASAPVPARRRITMNVQNTTVATDLEQIIDADAGVVKVLRNGQLLILRGDKQYNAQGQIVK